MKLTWLMTGLLILQALSFSAQAAKSYVPGRVIVANRTSGTLSIIDEKTSTLVKNVTVAGKYARPPEPMYVNYIANLNRLLVCDRSNNQIIALDAKNYRLINTVPMGKGAFHMWTDGVGKQTWAVNDVDKSFTIINPKTMKVLKTLSIPEDLKDQGGKPHDIILDKKGKYAFATIVGVGATTDPDYVVQYSTKTFAEIARFPTGKDPHVGVLNDGKLLFVPTQNASKVYVLDPNKQEENNPKQIKSMATAIDVPGAHGAAWTPNGQYFYTSNLPGIASPVDGKNYALWTIDTKTKEVVSQSLFPDAPKLKAAHNITINGNGSKLYLTHSGHEDGDSTGDVSIYNITGPNGVPVLEAIISVGINPFGIAYVPGK
jgi:DNA-binding beta-propeller fold protein YncE